MTKEMETANHCCPPTDSMKLPVAPNMQTARLHLQPVGLSDAPAIQALFPQWDIVRELAAGVPWPYPPDGARVFLSEVVLPAIARGEEWGWCLHLRERPGLLIGVISLRTKMDDNRGFWLGLPWQGRGYMSEACEAVTRFWFETLAFERLRVPKSVGNVASRRISQREGGRVIWRGERNFVAGPAPAELWELTREEWSARRRTAAAS